LALARWIGLLGASALLVLRPNLKVYLRSVDRHIRGRLDTEAHLCAIARQDGDLDVVADHDALSGLPRQDEHEPQFLHPTGVPAPPDTVSILIVKATGYRPTWRDDYLSTSQLAELSLALIDDLEPKAQSTYLLTEHA
jgi:hypothetical protein